MKIEKKQKSRTDNNATDQIINLYKERAAYQHENANALSLKLTTFTWLRLVFAFLGFIFCGEAISTGEFYPMGLLGLGSLAIFAALVSQYRKIKARLNKAKGLEVINLETIDRINRNWTELPKPTEVSAGLKEHAHTDLNVIGHASLQQLLGGITKQSSMDKMAKWLSTPVSGDVIALRQAAVQELRDDIEHRQDVYYASRGYENRNSRDDVTSWVKSNLAPCIPHAIVCALPIALLTLIALSFFNTLFLIPALFILSANVLLSMRWYKRCGSAFSKLYGVEDQLNQHSALVRILLKTFPTSPLLKEIKATLTDSTQDVSKQLDDLASIISWSEVRKSGMLYLVLQSLLLWDFHIYRKMYKWKATYGHKLEGWIVALSEYEVLSAAAELAFNNQAWAYPSVSDAHEGIHAKKMGHPLIPENVRVENDVEVNPRGKFLLVTGSNMSGKSTLLRSIGLNVLLSRLGAPVCAKEMSIPVLDVATCFSVDDSLSEGLSFYMAELKHIKRIIDKVESNDAEGVPTLYLLDEILQGTNSQERHSAVTSILEHLLAKNAIGAISTHDLALATSPSLQDNCNKIYFKEEISTTGGETVMSFDYQARQGVSNTSNALKLLEAVGLAN